MFRISKCHKGQKHLAKGMCKKCYDKYYYKQNKKRMYERKLKWARNNPERVNKARIKYRYGLSLEKYKIMVKQQKGLCEICKEQKRLGIDHNHFTKEIRGLLCNTCNQGIGLLKESVVLLERAIRYINSFKKEVNEIYV